MSERHFQEKLINAFELDPNLARAMTYQMTYSIFNIAQSFWEREFSDMLAWLLSPNESHMLGDTIIKVLLRQLLKYSSNNKEEYKKLQEILKLSLSNLIVEKEYSLKNKHIDILAIDPTQKVLIIIENKYGAKEGPNQRKTYKKLILEKFNDKDFKKVFIYIDQYQINEYLENDKGADWDQWHKIDTSWLSEQLKARLNSPHLTDNSKKLFRDFYIELTGNYEDIELFSDSLEAIKQLAKDHRELLDDYEKYNGDSGDFNDDEIFVHKYSSILDKMSEHDNFTEIQEELIKLTNEFEFDIRDNRLFFTTKKINTLTVSNQLENWPIDVGINYELTPTENGEKKYKYYCRLYTDTNLLEKIDEKYVETILSLIKETSRAPRHKKFSIQEISNLKDTSTIAKSLFSIFKKHEEVFNKIENANNE